MDFVNRITRGNLRFSSLIVSLVKADDKGSPSLVQSPSIEFIVPVVGLCNDAWTEKAWRIADWDSVSHGTKVTLSLEASVSKGFG